MIEKPKKPKPKKSLTKNSSNKTSDHNLQLIKYIFLFLAFVILLLFILIVIIIIYYPNKMKELKEYWETAGLWFAIGGSAHPLFKWLKNFIKYD